MHPLKVFLNERCLDFIIEYTIFSVCGHKDSLGLQRGTIWGSAGVIDCDFIFLTALPQPNYCWCVSLKLGQLLLVCVMKVDSSLWLVFWDLCG
jgi:hypothetical protein